MEEISVSISERSNADPYCGVLCVQLLKQAEAAINACNWEEALSLIAQGQLQGMTSDIVKSTAAELSSRVLAERDKCMARDHYFEALQEGQKKFSMTLWPCLLLISC